MNAAQLIDALRLPSASSVDRRVPKTALVEHGAPTPADRRRINDGVERLQWLAALKPSNVGVPAFADGQREYLEVAVLSLELRPRAAADRLNELVHRATPYPLLLMTEHGDALTMSLGHKRWSLGDAGRVVIDGGLVAAVAWPCPSADVTRDFLRAMALDRQPRANLYFLYQGWIDAVTALLAAVQSGQFTPFESLEEARACRETLAECARLEAAAAGLRSAAAKERQISRQVERNLEIQRIAVALESARKRLKRASGE